MKRILVIVDDFINVSNKAGATMMHELVLDLSLSSSKVTVITPSYKLQKNFKITKNNNYQLVEFKSGKLKNINKFKRAINEFLLPFIAYYRLKNWILNNKHDYIIYYSPTIFFGPFIIFLKKVWNVKTYLILRDVFPQWAIDSGILSENSIITKFFKIIEKINYSAANRIGMMSQNNVKWFIKNYKKNNVEILYNWTSCVTNHKTKIDYKTVLKLKNKVVLFYGGNIGFAQDMNNLINLVYHFKGYSNVHFVFVGDGDEVNLVLERKIKQRLDNLTYLKSVDKDTYNDMLSSFDIGLFSLHRNHKTHNFPGKLLSYMSFSKPILGSCNIGNDLKDIINESNSGFIYNNGDDKKLFDSCLKLINSKKLRRDFGKNGNILLKNRFSTRSASSQILNYFN